MILIPACGEEGKEGRKGKGSRDSGRERETQREEKEDSETGRHWGVINRRTGRSQSSAHITYLLQPTSSSSSSQESRRLRVWGCPASPDLPRASYPAEFHTYSRSRPSVAVVQLVGKLWSTLFVIGQRAY